jgi:antitoxin (DNA-binding transcriptional repressor) of toxin-antitoxin stability system
MVQVTAEEAKSKLSDLIAQAMGGETVLIKEDENSIVLLMPFASSKGKRQFGSAKGLIHISEDFDQPLEDFKEYME